MKIIKKDTDGIIIEDAIRLIAEYLPDGRGEIKPTLLHCIRVGTYLYINGYPLEVVLAGYLHDLIEDSDIKLEIISSKFGERVLQIVLNNSKDLSLEKEQRKEAMITLCATIDEETAIVKATDLLDNFRYFLKIQGSDGLGTVHAHKYAKLFIEQVPATYTADVFEELKAML